MLLKSLLVSKLKDPEFLKAKQPIKTIICTKLAKGQSNLEMVDPGRAWELFYTSLAHYLGYYIWTLVTAMGISDVLLR